MKPIKIATDGEGNGRAKNPYNRNHDLEDNERWKDFAKANPLMPVFQNGVPFKVKGEFQAVVKHQYQSIYDLDQWFSYDGKEKLMNDIRQIFEIITPKVERL